MQEERARLKELLDALPPVLESWASRNPRVRGVPVANFCLNFDFRTDEIDLSGIIDIEPKFVIIASFAKTLEENERLKAHGTDEATSYTMTSEELLNVVLDGEPVSWRFIDELATELDQFFDSSPEE